MNFVLLSSSRGTTMQAVIEAIEDRSLTAPCLGLIIDRADRGCASKAKVAHLPITIVERKAGETREGYDKRLHEAIISLGGLPPNNTTTEQSNNPTIIAALGWMYILSPWFVRLWKNRMINVHPSLLPMYTGAHAIEEALAAGETETGMTIHMIDEGLDTGNILVQKKCSINPDDTEETLKARIQELEKEWYPKVLQQIHTGELRID